MKNGPASLLAALHARGQAPFLLLDDRSLSGVEIATAVESACESTPLPSLVPGDIVALRGGAGIARVAAPLAAWSRGWCTNLLGDREPTSSIDSLLASSGARALLAWSDDELQAIPLRPRHTVSLPVGTLLHTSGSGGRAKLVVHRLEQHVESARAAIQFLGLVPEDRLLLSLPTHHVGGLALIFRAILSGAALCVPARGVPLEQALRRHHPTHVSLVGTQLARLLRSSETTAALGRCRAVLLGGGPVSPSLRERALEAGVPLVISYGATETASFVAASAEPDIVRRPFSAGRPLPGRDVVVDNAGEILIGGPTLSAGRLEEGAVRTGPRDAGRWRTGDRGRIEDGVLYVTGRRDRMFVSGGENVQPEEIEMALLGQPGVDEAVVVPIVDKEFGARPVAFIRGGALSAAGLDAALREVLPGYKTPDVYYRMPARPAGRLKPDLSALAARAGDPVAAARLPRL